MERFVEIDIDAVIVGDRIRKDHGDIDSLAASIEDVGLLQPIGITPANVLIFGERRLRAFRFLERQTIAAQVIDIPSILAGEDAENGQRKDWSLSERVAIGRALEQEIGERRGGSQNRHVPGLLPETGQLAAVKSGLGSDRTYRKAKDVVDRGAPEIIKAVDEKRMTINEAAQIIHLNPAAQAKVADLPRKDRAAAVGTANARSAAAKVRHTPRAAEVLPGSARLRILLQALESLSIALAERGHRTSEEIEKAFSHDMDWKSEALLAQFRRLRPLGRALGMIFSVDFGEG